MEAVAERLLPVTPAVLLEVSDLHADPYSRLRRAANAARYAASVADEPLKTVAVALAEELEQRSVSGHQGLWEIKMLTLADAKKGSLKSARKAEKAVSVRCSVDKTSRRVVLFVAFDKT